MLVYAAKLSVKKAVIGVAVLAAVVVGIGCLSQTAMETVDAMGQNTLSQKLKSNEERVAYLQSFGWQVEQTPLAETEVRIPDTFDAAYQSYNELQLSQGLDLTDCQGKNAMLYSYHVTNYPTEQTDVTANLVLYKNKVVAADISAVSDGGFVQGLTMETEN